MIEKLLHNWKTTSSGLIMIIGSVVHLVFSIIDHTATESIWTVSLTAIVAGFGLMFASDSARVKEVAKAVDKINQDGASPDTEMLSKPTEPKP